MSGTSKPKPFQHHHELRLTYPGTNCLPHTDDREDIQPDPSNPVCVMVVGDTTLLRIPKTFSIDVPLARPRKWMMVTPVGHYDVIWGPAGGDSEMTHVSKGGAFVCDSNGLKPGAVIGRGEARATLREGPKTNLIIKRGLEIVSIWRRILRLFMPESISASAEQCTQEAEPGPV
ncbi:hypothetical protein PIB30_016115 [Stylosanthes scabra]|uniref:Uncharacterized protein n=1 Tax=Stylosanthes scabra TaxID=79078 RepID=A0ABU6R7H0_9FABA|nr:hypothetical protein [Stylosanthes scabra]